MTQRTRDLRRYYFRHFVAEHDVQWCKHGNGPMVLTWEQARFYWTSATGLARKRMLETA